MTTIFNHLTIAQAYEYLHNLNDKIPEVLSDSEFLNLVKADPVLKDCVIHMNKISYIPSKNIGLQEFKNLTYLTFINIYDRITWALPLWEIEYVHDLPEFKFNGL
jgi:hypothetical protein